MLQDVEKKDRDCISPFPLLTKDAVESLRYRAQVCNIPIVDYINLNPFLAYSILLLSAICSTLFESSR